MPSKAELTRRVLKKALRLIASDHPNDTGQAPMARAIGVKQPHIWFWLNKAKKGVPEKHWYDIEKSVGFAVQFPRDA